MKNDGIVGSDNRGVTVSEVRSDVGSEQGSDNRSPLQDGKHFERKRSRLKRRIEVIRASYCKIHDTGSKEDKRAVVRCEQRPPRMCARHVLRSRTGFAFAARDSARRADMGRERGRWGCTRRGGETRWGEASRCEARQAVSGRGEAMRGKARRVKSKRIHSDYEYAHTLLHAATVKWWLLYV